jgi:hypothetical protein
MDSHGLSGKLWFSQVKLYSLQSGFNRENISFAGKATSHHYSAICSTISHESPMISVITMRPRHGTACRSSFALACETNLIFRGKKKIALVKMKSVTRTDTLNMT